MYLLGYDIGSSTIKVALVDAQSHETVGMVQYPDTEMDIISRQSGWAEQQPEVWWQDFCFATRKLLLKTAIDPGDIRGIGISYQMHGLVLIDQDKRALRPSIIWCDSRAVTLGDKAFLDIGQSWCLENCLNSPGNFTASRLKWVKDNEPDTYYRASSFLLPGDFIAMKLTGNVFTTISGLSEGIMWDFNRKQLADPVFDYFELDRELVPPITGTFSVQGEVDREAAEMTGLKEGTPLTFRAGDQPTNALALNVVNPGEIAATCGTSGVVYGIVDKPLYDNRSRVNSFAHVNYEDNFDRIGVLLCVNGAGLQYSWMKHQVARSERDYRDMERMAASVPIGSDGLCILPFGNGSERILENKNLNSHIYNLQFNRHNRAHLYRAALEGVAFSFVYGVNILKDMGLDLEIMRVGNDNMFQSEVFSMTIATLLDCHIEVVETTGAVGAAKAAGVAAGIYRNLGEALEGVRPARIYEPRLNHALCSQAYSFWNSSLNKALVEKLSKGTVNTSSVLEELEEKKRELASATLKLVAKRDFLTEIKEDLIQLGYRTEGRMQKEMNRLVEKIGKQLGPDKDWEAFEQQFNLLNGNFFKKLRQKVPGINAQDARLCAYIRLNMSTKELAEKLNLSVRGVETKRYRLRKKLGLTKQESLEHLLQNL